MDSWYVDDDADMIRAMSMLLSLMDIRVRSFLNVRAAVREFQAGKRPGLLLLDINIPEVSGIDLLEFLRRDPQYDDLPILMLSSEHTDVQVDEALAKGADGYAMKPVTFEELESAVQAAVAKRTTLSSASR